MSGLEPKKAGKAPIRRAAFLAAALAALGAACATDTGYDYEYRQLRPRQSGMDASEFGQARPQDLNDPRFAQVKWYVDHDQFQKALAAFKSAARGLKKSQPLIELRGRLDLAARSYPELSPVEKWEVSLSSSLRYLCYGDDRGSMLHASYSLNLNRNDMALDTYVTNLEKVTRQKAERFDADAATDMIGEILRRVGSANDERNYDLVRSLLNEVIELDPDNATALERLGTVDFQLARYQDAIDAWEKAVRVETEPGEVDSLRQYIKIAYGKFRRRLPLPGGMIKPPPLREN